MIAANQLLPLREVIKKHNLRAQKSLGQNFLLDQNITNKIVRQAGNLSGLTVFEIGPGPGGLTRALLKSKAEKVIAVEYDERAVNALQELKAIYPGRLKIIHGDALAIDLVSLSETPRAIIANLPYNIATPLLIKWLRQIREKPEAFHSMTLMFQKEVAERILARPKTKAYGRLSVISQWLCDIKSVYDLPPSAFIPPPKVNSTVLQFKPKKLPENAPFFEAVEKITAAAFNQRRKMIRSSLREFLPILKSLDIPETARAEELSVQNYIDIARKV